MAKKKVVFWSKKSKLARAKRIKHQIALSRFDIRSVPGSSTHRYGIFDERIGDWIRNGYYMIKRFKTKKQARKFVRVYMKTH